MTKKKTQKTQDLTESTLNSVAIQKEVQTEEKLKQEDKRLKVCLKSNMENKSDLKEKGKKGKRGKSKQYKEDKKSTSHKRK